MADSTCDQKNRNAWFIAAGLHSEKRLSSGQRGDVFTVLTARSENISTFSCRELKFNFVLIKGKN